MRLPGMPILAALGLLLASGAAPAPAQGPGHVRARVFGFQEGLTNLSVLAVAQGNDGMIYAGTEAGLFRYNGHRFEPLDLPTDYRFITSLLPDPEEGLWIGTRHGLGLLDPAGSFQAGGNLPAEHVRTLSFDAQGALWVHSFGATHRREHATRAFRAVDPPKGAGRITAVVAVPERAGARLVDPAAIWNPAPGGGWTRESLPPGARNALAAGADGAGWTWIRSSAGMFRRGPGAAGWERVRGVFDQPAPDNLRITRDREGWLWVNTPAGIARCRGREVRLVRPDAGGNRPRTAMVDQEGTPWLGATGVVQVLGRGLWTVYGVEDGLPDRVAWNAARDARGRLWAATSGGLAVADGGRWRTVRLGHFSRVRRHPDGSMLAVGSPGGVLYRVDPDTLAVEALRVPTLAPSPVSRGLGIGADGTVWVSDYQQGLAEGRRAGGTWTWGPVRVDGKRVDDIFEVVQDGRGEVFLCTRAGVYYRDGGAWRSLGTPPALTPLGAVRDPAGDIWVAYLEDPVLTRHHRSGNGWTCAGTVRPFLNRPGLVVYALDADARGRLWVGTSQGLARLGPGGTSLEAWFAPGEGIPSADATSQGLLVEPDGSLWYGTSEGLGAFDTRAETPLPPPKPPILLEWRAGGALLPTFFPPVIRAGRPLDARFGTSSFCAPTSLTLEARLPGVDSDWVPVEGLHVRYSAIPPGQRELEVRLVRNGVPAGRSLVLPFRVLPHWWETWWARAGGALAATAAVWALLRARHRTLRSRNEALASEVALRTRELREANAELERASRAKDMFLASMSHELRTPLNAILLYSELLQDGALERNDAESSSDLRKIQAAGRHLLAMINNVLDMAKIEAGMMQCSLEETDLPTLLAEVRDTLLPLADARGNRLDITCQPGLPGLVTDITKLRQILLNLGGNACKFTERGVIRLEARDDGDGLAIAVADTGPGLDPDQFGRIFEAFEQGALDTYRRHGGTGLGLTISQRLVQLLGGTLEAWSAPGEGARFTVRLPRTPAAAMGDK